MGRPVKIHLTIGDTFGKLTVIGKTFSKGTNHRYAPCRCECGTEKDIYVSDLTSGKTTSCRCSQTYSIQDILLNITLCEPSALETGCWIWQGSKNRAGYGRISFQGKRETLVHRLLYEYFKAKRVTVLKLLDLRPYNATGDYIGLVSYELAEPDGAFRNL